MRLTNLVASKGRSSESQTTLATLMRLQGYLDSFMLAHQQQQHHSALQPSDLVQIIETNRFAAKTQDKINCEYLLAFFERVGLHIV
jgi:hypothetical protein